MAGYVIFTDGSAELYEGFFKKYPVSVIPILVDEKGYHPVSPKIANDSMEAALLEGSDVLYIGMSSKISSSFEVVEYLAKGLRIKYPERQIEFVDSLTSSCSLGLLVYLAAKMRKEGKSLSETAGWIEANKKRIKNMFVLDSPSDCEYLTPGGAKSSQLDIRQIFGIENGTLTVVGKTIGRKKALSEMARIMKDEADPSADFVVVEYIAQKMEAENFADKIKETIPGISVKIIEANKFVSHQLSSDGLGIAYISKE
ncbi:MAG: DegV family protein [Clostridia bacterium]|nr:DegV family protein [Clostridia bacterium]